jgi:hypothetical protein
MDKPKEETSLDQYRTRGAFTVAAVRGDNETQGMEAQFAEAHLALKALDRSREDLEETVQEHEAVIVWLDRSCDRIIRSFELRLLDLVSKKRDDPRYRRYFPEGLRAVTETDERAVQPKLVRGILAALEDDKAKPDFAPLHSEFHAKLLAAVQAVEAADGACTKVEDELGYLVDRKIAEAKTHWLEERTKLHAELTKKFPHDPARVESYFRRFARPRKKKVASKPEGGDK